MDRTPEYALIYDTETTGLPDWSKPSGEPHQPHIVQIGAQLVKYETRDIVQEISLLIRPNGWTIPQEASDIHGISTEQASDCGIGEEQAIDLFMQLWHANDDILRVGHSEKFDARMLRIAQHRFGYPESEMNDWKGGAAECTGFMGRKRMDDAGIGKYRGYKIPKLIDSYEFYMGRSIPTIKQHTAIGDCDATRELFFAIIDRDEDDRAAGK